MRSIIVGGLLLCGVVSSEIPLRGEGIWHRNAPRHQKPILANSAEEPPEPDALSLVSATFLDDEHDIIEGDRQLARDTLHSGGHGIWHGRADARGPGGIMGDHVHRPGEWMAEYKLMHMRMGGVKFGTSSLTPPQYFATSGFGVMPTTMDMDMHMVHVMRGWTENVTPYLMLMGTSLTMDHLAMGGAVSFRTVNTGFDDMTIGTLWRVWQGCTDELIINLGFSVPTGDISKRIPPGVPPGGQEFPYPMRLGNGTVDFIPGITYKRAFGRGSLGAQFVADVPIGENWSDYGVGSEYRVNLWLSRLITRKVSVSLRTEVLWKENFRGADRDLAMLGTMVPTARPDMRGGEFVNLGYGFNLGPWHRNRIRVEFMHPVYENLKGYQLGHDFTLFASWSIAH